MTIHKITSLIAALVVTVTIACAAAPSSGSSPTPTASPVPSATTQPTTAPTATPTAALEAAYLDDRSSAEQLIRSYYDAVSKRQYLRAYWYWEPSTTLPPYDIFAKGFTDTTSAQVELGTVGGGVGAGQLYWSVPAAVFSTTSGGAQNFVGCYTVHLARPEIQTDPPFKPMAIQTAQVSSVASPAAARSGLATACGTANANPLPWGAAGAGIDAAQYVDNRSVGEAVVRSYYNAVNRKEYSRAYSYWESGTAGFPPFGTFAAGYANTKSVTLVTKPGTTDVGTGQLYYSVPAVETSSNADGSTTTYSGCFKLHLGSPNAQATPPFQPLGIQSAKLARAASGANATDLLNAACS